MRNRRRVIIIAQLLIALGLVLGIWLGLRATTAAPSPVAPEYLGSMPLTDQVIGEEAVSEMGQLHGKEIGLINGYVARYQADGDRATVWMGQAESPLAAEELLQRMTDGIRKGNESFQNLEELVVGGKDVYSVLGGGERHYYYTSTDKVIWLAISASEPLKLLEEALRTIE